MFFVKCASAYHLYIAYGIDYTTTDENNITGVKTVSGAIYHCKAVIICSGTYLNARCLTGEMISYTGPNGLQAANHLTQSLLDNGIEIQRFKTGTPARINKKTIIPPILNHII